MRIGRAHGYQHLSAAAEMNLGFAYLMNSDAARARRLLTGVLDRARATGETTWVHSAFLGLALAAGADADPAIAATLHGAADHQYEQAGQAFDVKESTMRSGDHARLRDALGEAGFDAAYSRGRALSQADAIALAVGTAQPEPGPQQGPGPERGPQQGMGPEPEPGPRQGPGPQPDPGPLSARERQIMALLAGGASNTRIAETLYVTPNTVRTHLDRIRDKTGARNRAELTRYAIQAGIEPVVLSS